MEIRTATEADWPAIWAIIEPVIREGETLAIDRHADEAAGRAYWHAPEKSVFVARDQAGTIVGSYTLRANKDGPAGHVANAGYVVRHDHRGRGIAQTLCLHSLQTAHALGFRAMQFNLVVSSNRRAVKLWQHMGFEIVGTLPGAFRHPHLGYVDAFIMYQALAE